MRAWYTKFDKIVFYWCNSFGLIFCIGIFTDTGNKVQKKKLYPSYITSKESECESTLLFTFCLSKHIMSKVTQCPRLWSEYWSEVWNAGFWFGITAFSIALHFRLSRDFSALFLMRRNYFSISKPLMFSLKYTSCQYRCLQRFLGREVLQY